MKTFAYSLILTIAATVGGQAWAEEAQSAIMAGAPVFVETYNASDGAALAAFYTEDAALLPPGGARVNGREAIAAFWQGAMDSGLVINSLTPTEIMQSGDQAVDVGTISLSAPDGSGGMVELSAKYTVMWKQDSECV
ncbi:MAG: DUF4440 domain-containing protein [Alphaproteobacteria bacterium]|nr:DUF4440 domain-containing protein [Rhodospirillaceae bacterium]MDG2481173.1 DUF4440 domain-containing protein [Alphaproteobacteria bacterium]MBT5434148.1 DUF4440 domain-containing protein [Rhodospirillaceae bacterium]MBT6202454.1 DUF4440 domain-containing protein [Rhodospirillaceae bacterium]MBT7611941.1 DUF4440 domain-containing protein [Rhodospirillaceae bacterium]